MPKTHTRMFVYGCAVLWNSTCLLGQDLFFVIFDSCTIAYFFLDPNLCQTSTNCKPKRKKSLPAEIPKLYQAKYCQPIFVQTNDFAHIAFHSRVVCIHITVYKKFKNVALIFSKNSKMSQKFSQKKFLMSPFFFYKNSIMSQ